MSEQVIVKVQRPLNQFPGPKAGWLVYAEGKQNTRVFPHKSVPPHVRSQMGGDFKAYFVAELAASGTHWIIGNRTEEQSW